MLAAFFRLFLVVSALNTALPVPASTYRQADHDDRAPALDVAGMALTAPARPHDPLPLQPRHVSDGPLLVRSDRAFAQHANIRVLGFPSEQGCQPISACLHVPRRRLPRLRDDADDP